MIGVGFLSDALGFSSEQPQGSSAVETVTRPPDTASWSFSDTFTQGYNIAKEWLFGSSDSQEPGDPATPPAPVEPNDSGANSGATQPADKTMDISLDVNSVATLALVGAAAIALILFVKR